MDSRSYKIGRVCLVTLQIFLTLLIMITNLYDIFVGIADNEGDLIEHAALYLGNIAVSVMLLVYALYGYLHKDTSLRMACVAYLMASSVNLSEMIGKVYNTEGANWSFCIASMLAIVLMFMFCFTYKHRKELAMVLGGVATVLNVIVGSGSVFSESKFDIIKDQPFAMALLSASITVCFITRYQWRQNEKRKAANENDSDSESAI